MFEIVLRNARREKFTYYARATGWHHAHQVARKWIAHHFPESARAKAVSFRMVAVVPVGGQVIDEDRLDRVQLHRHLDFPLGVLLNDELRALADLSFRFPFLRLEVEEGKDFRESKSSWAILSGPKGQERYSARVHFTPGKRFEVSITADGTRNPRAPITGFWWRENRDWFLHPVNQD